MNTIPSPITRMLEPGHFRTAIMALQMQMLQLPQSEFETRHTLANGAYVREVTLPAGCIVIGEIHRHEHINMLIKGEITVVTEEGMKRLIGPCTFVSPSGTKKAAYTHTEVIWANVHATQSTDIEEIKREMIIEEVGLIDGFINELIGV